MNAPEAQPGAALASAAVPQADGKPPKIVRIRLKEIRPAAPPGGLAGLDQVDLSPRYRQMLETAMTRCGGPAAWRNRKRAETRDLLALAQISGRMTVGEIDLSESLRAWVQVRVPVPLDPDANGQLGLADHAVLGLTYRAEAIRVPQPGFSFVQLLEPRGGVWHANVGPPEHGQPVCLGLSLDAGTPLREIVLLTYGALSMQSVAVMIDERDSAGVMNWQAARWWQQNVHRIPLSREPFLPVAKENACDPQA